MAGNRERVMDRNNSEQNLKRDLKGAVLDLKLSVVELKVHDSGCSTSTI